MQSNVTELPFFASKVIPIEIPGIVLKNSQICLCYLQAVEGFSLFWLAFKLYGLSFMCQINLQFRHKSNLLPCFGLFSLFLSSFFVIKSGSK